MPRTTETYDLEAERDRIDTKLDELADEVAELDEDSPLRGQKIEEASNLERQLAGLDWALATPDADEDDHPDRPYQEVTIGALTAGEYAEVRDTLDGDSDPTMGRAGTTGILFAAQGVADAPFLEGSEDLTGKIVAVRELSPHFQDWLSARVDEISTPQIEGNGFAQRVAESETSATTPK